MSASTDPRKGKPGQSCAECRRNFPCQSCIRRGCPAICPDGTLAATRGNKVLMARAQRLKEQVQTMSTRIKELETALANVQNGSLPLPALKTGSLQDHEPHAVEYERELDRVSESVGSLAINSEGKAQYYGASAGPEHLMPEVCSVLSSAPCILKQVSYQGFDASTTRTIQDPKDLGLPREILELVYAFPLGFRDRAYMIADFARYIPYRERAIELADLCYEHATWLIDPVQRGDFDNTIMEPLYVSVHDPVPLANFEPHRLSLFFIVIAIGALFDSHPSARIIGEQYHAFACATFSLESIADGATSASIQALFMMAHFLLLTDRSGGERRWLIIGLTCRVIHMVKRDSGSWNLEEEEVQRRRNIFWECYTWDCWACILYGRPPVLDLAHSDCRFPRDLEPHVLPSGSSELGFHSWMHHYIAACLSVSVQRTHSVHRASYSSFIELDKRIRSFPLPSHLHSPVYGTERRDWDVTPSRAMRQYFVPSSVESNLIYIHRSWFAEALRDSEDPLQHEYGQSVISIYRSANILINGMRSLCAAHPKEAGRVWFFWSCFYTSSILLGAIVVKCPGCKLARPALTLLEESFTVYEQGSRLCRPPATVPMLEKLCARARHTYATFCSNAGRGPQITPITLPDDIHDLSAFGGTKGGVIKSPASSPPKDTSSP
ncbi:fungal-specific transcription factor domain-containing protein, partial [Russula aff. rugulosa BPL654]